MYAEEVLFENLDFKNMPQEQVRQYLKDTEINTVGIYEKIQLQIQEAKEFFIDELASPSKGGK